MLALDENNVKRGVNMKVISKLVVCPTLTISLAPLQPLQGSSKLVRLCGGRMEDYTVWSILQDYMVCVLCNHLCKDRAPRGDSQYYRVKLYSNSVDIEFMELIVVVHLHHCTVWPLQAWGALLVEKKFGLL